MQLFVGLGNPGSKYSNNRHNAGFMIIDALAEDNLVQKWTKKHNGEVAEITIDGEKIILLKPQTYMNVSGRSVQSAMSFYKLTPEQVTVFHDDLDIPTAKIKIKTGGGHGGHNGLRDIDAQIGKEYRRVRIGIDHPGHKDAVSGYVLSNFGKAEREEIDKVIIDIIRNISLLAKGDETELLKQI